MFDYVPIGGENLFEGTWDEIVANRRKLARVHKVPAVGNDAGIHRHQTQRYQAQEVDEALQTMREDFLAHMREFYKGRQKEM